MTMVPASLILAGSFAARASSTVGALADVAGALVVPPSDSESEPQAVRARAVVATAATASARVRIMKVLLSQGAPGDPGASVCGVDPATAGREARHTDITSVRVDGHRGATCVTPGVLSRAGPACHDGHLSRPPPRSATARAAPPSDRTPGPRSSRPGPVPSSRGAVPMAASPHVPLFDPESPVFRAHEGGKLGVHATQPLRDRDDLALLYTPGVAEVSLATAADPSLSTRYTARGNTVAVISDGTAVLGLGDIGPLGAMPVMEGKGVLFKHFAGIDAVPVVMETGTVEELVEAIARIAPALGG